MVGLKCKRCSYVWDYGGESKFYATCPQCLWKVNVVKQRVALATGLPAEKKKVLVE